ncbi:MAG: CotH kinase family protein, partial [Thermoanaerobaculia bacterium]
MDRDLIRGSFLVLGLTLALPAGSLRAQRAAEEAASVFDPAPVLQLKIELGEEARRQLEGNHKAFVRATVREGEKVYAEVGLRLKGSAGSFRNIYDSKPGFTLKFNQFMPAGRFHGLKKLHLNNGAQDPTYLSELIGNEVFRAAGVPAQRVGHARIELNGRSLGLYMVIEAVTRDFLARWFTDTSGTYFEGPGEINSGSLDVDSEGGQPRPGGREALEALAEAAVEPDPARRMERLEKLLDVDRFISFLCVEAITSHWDGYAIGVNNYHLYHEPKSGRFTFFPHGIDQLFQQPHAPAVIQGNGLVARGVLGTAAGKARYRERFKVLFENLFEVEAIQKRIDEVTASLGPMLRAIDPAQAEAQAQHARDLSSRIVERARNLRQQMGIRRQSLAFDQDGRARPTAWQPKDHI